MKLGPALATCKSDIAKAKCLSDLEDYCVALLL